MENGEILQATSGTELSSLLYRGKRGIDEGVVLRLIEDEREETTEPRSTLRIPLLFGPSGSVWTSYLESI